jgi:hypothetical protein
MTTQVTGTSTSKSTNSQTTISFGDGSSLQVESATNDNAGVNPTAQWSDHNTTLAFTNTAASGETATQTISAGTGSYEDMYGENNYKSSSQSIQVTAPDGSSTGSGFSIYANNYIPTSGPETSSTDVTVFLNQTDAKGASIFANLSFDFGGTGANGLPTINQGDLLKELAPMLDDTLTNTGIIPSSSSVGGSLLTTLSPMLVVTTSSSDAGNT